MIRPQKTVHLVWGEWGRNQRGKGEEKTEGGRGMRDADGWGEEGCTRLNAPLASRSLLSEHTQDTALGSLAVAAMVLCPFSK